MINEKISVIIPVYNGERTIRRAIDAVLNQSRSTNVEIIVVDDGSKDNTYQSVTNCSSIVYVKQENAGPATARNRGARTATGEVLFFTDADCIPEPQWLEKMLEPLKDPSVAVVSGSYQIANPDSLLARCIQAEIAYRHRTLMSNYPKSFGSYNFCVRKNVFQEVGGFNSSYPQASGEDNDLSYRILARGYKIYFEKSAAVAHHHPEEVRDYLRDQFRHGYWRALLYRDHPGMMKGDDYTFWKDMVEVPVSLGLVAFTILCGFNVLPFEWLIWIAALFFILELLFAVLMVRELADALFWGLVMLLRSFARAFGFVAGFIAISGREKGKKS